VFHPLHRPGTKMEMKAFDLGLYSLICEDRKNCWLRGPLEPLKLGKQYGWLIKPD
jgi:hypothetical protein